MPGAQLARWTRLEDCDWLDHPYRLRLAAVSRRGPARCSRPTAKDDRLFDRKHKRRAPRWQGLWNRTPLRRERRGATLQRIDSWPHRRWDSPRWQLRRHRQRDAHRAAQPPPARRQPHGRRPNARVGAMVPAVQVLAVPPPLRARARVLRSPSHTCQRKCCQFELCFWKFNQVVCNSNLNRLKT